MPNELIFKSIFFIFITLAVILEVIGDVLFKKWSIGEKNSLFTLGLAIYFLGSIFWALSLRYEYLTKAISIFTLLNLIIITLVGALIFKEDLSLINKIGVALGVVAIILIEL